MQTSKQACGSTTKPHKKAQPSTTSLPISERMFLRAKDCADYLSISKSHFHTLVRAGTLPQGKLVSGAIRVWKRDEIEIAAKKMWEGR